MGLVPFLGEVHAQVDREDRYLEGGRSTRKTTRAVTPKWLPSWFSWWGSAPGRDTEVAYVNVDDLLNRIPEMQGLDLLRSRPPLLLWQEHPFLNDLFRIPENKTFE